MTPAVAQLKKNGIAHSIHVYEHDVGHESYGLEAAEKLGVPAEYVFKTLVVSSDTQIQAVGIVPVNKQLNFKLLALALGMKKVQMASPEVVQRKTGYVLGGVSPLAQKVRLPTVIDESANKFEEIYVSGGRRGLEICLSPMDLAQALQAKFSSIAA